MYEFSKVVASFGYIVVIILIAPVLLALANAINDRRNGKH